MSLIRVPERFAADTLAREGEAAWAWLARLPELAGELCARWGLRVTGDPMHGYLALVVPVLRGGVRYALKLSWIDDETVSEAAALALWNGGGAVRLLDADCAAGAMLLEWLDPLRTLKEAGRHRLALARRQAVMPLQAPAATSCGWPRSFSWRGWSDDLVWMGLAVLVPVRAA